MKTACSNYFLGDACTDFSYLMKRHDAGRYTNCNHYHKQPPAESVSLNLNRPEVPQAGREETSSLMTALVVKIAIYYPFGPLEMKWD